MPQAHHTPQEDSSTQSRAATEAAASVRVAPSTENPAESSSTIAMEDETATIRSRVRAAIATLFGAGALYMLVSWLAPSREILPPQILQTMQAVLLVLAFLELGRPCSKDRVHLTSVVVVAVTCAMVAASAAPDGGIRAIAITCILTCLATATLLPWGVPAQAATVTLAASVLIGAAHSQHSSIFAALDPATITLIVFALGASVYTTREFQRNRRARMAEEEARRVAEQNLRAMNDRLEARVQESTQELEQALEEIHSISYTVSHDLRSPLRVIHGFNQMIEDEAGDILPPHLLEYMGRVRTASSRMGKLIDSLLSLSRMRYQEMQDTRVDLSALARRHADALCNRDGERNVEWSIQPGMLVQGDAGLLEVAVDHLLSNAWKYTRETDCAKIRFDCVPADSVPGKHSSDGTIFRVTDNGAGFDMRFYEKLFQPFESLHPRHEFDGIGMGLAAVERIIGRHGGKVWAESREGNGATFHFHLPDDPAGERPDEAPAKNSLELTEQDAGRIRQATEARPGRTQADLRRPGRRSPQLAQQPAW